MASTRFVNLKRSVAISALVGSALAGCTTENQQHAQASISPRVTGAPATQTAQNTQPASGTTTTASVDVAEAKTPAAAGKSPRLPQQGSAPVQTANAASMQERFGGATQTAGVQTASAAIASATGATATVSPVAAYANASQPMTVALPTPNPARPDEAAEMAPVSVATTLSPSSSPLQPTPEMAAIEAAVPTPRPDAGSFAPGTQVAYASLSSKGTSHYDFNFDTSGPTVVAATEVDSDGDNGDVPEDKTYISGLINKYAKIYKVPASLIHRVVHRESRYNPKAYNSNGYFGLMQIKYNTAKSMGYEGRPKGLLDAETNIKYAAKYLRGAWVVADSKPDDAVALYAHGYYYDAKRKGLSDIANGNY